MAAPTPVVTVLGDSNELAIIKVTVPAGGDTDVSATIAGDVSALTSGATHTNLNIMRVQWSANFSFNLFFDATTDDHALTLAKGSGDLDFSALANGIKNPRSSGVTGDVLFTTLGIADTEEDVKDSGFMILYLQKNTI